MPAIMAFGLWGIFSGRINMGISVVASMTLGIVVDDTVHFLSKYLRAVRGMGRPPRMGLQHAFETAGVAMIITSVVLSTGFMMLSFSDYYVTACIGSLAAMTILIALLADFLVLPALVVRFLDTSEKPLSKGIVNGNGCRKLPQLGQKTPI
jgi:predicted RND superfamily exporter protein